LVENIIQTTDTMRINYLDSDNLKEQEKNSIESLLNLIEEAIETSDPVTLSILDANAQQKDKIKQTHFYTDGDKNKSLQMQVIGTDTIYTAPPVISGSNSGMLPIKITAKKTPALNEVSIKNSLPAQRSYIHKYTIYYNVNEDKIPKSALKDLDEISQILINNPSIGAEIYGYTDSQGEKKYNLALSRQRAQKVLKHFIDNKIDQQKMIAKGFGEAVLNDVELNSNLNRKVVINIFEIKTK
jgi:outer membrane protein OmpA-like peptidoglycan-associated protein